MAGKRSRHILSVLNDALAVGGNSISSDEWIAYIKSEEYRIKTYYKYYNGWITDFYTAVSSLEYAFVHSIDCAELISMLLPGCDTRFGTMTALSIYVSLKGYNSVPEIWREKISGIHKEALQEWTTGSIQLIQNKYQKEIGMAGETLMQIKDDTQESILYDKILAGLLAGAIGNVMGSPVEDRDFPWIVEKYGVLDYILDPKRLETEDDAAMVKLWADSYIRCGGRIYPEDLGEAFLKDMQTVG